MYCDITITTNGKWVLAGEHAVLRGHPALVLPLANKIFKLHYQNTQKPWQIAATGIEKKTIQHVFKSALTRAMVLLNKPIEGMTGYFYLQNSIPVGVGLGASAALCVAISRWLAMKNLIKNADIASFAQQIEHLFHGQSSGLDIAGVASASAIFFQQGKQHPLSLNWQPYFALSSSKQTGPTAHCIQQVASLWQQNKALGQRIDLQMTHSVMKAQHALADTSEKAIDELAEAINNACACFEAWGLLNTALLKHINQLKEAGALAAKPTGSGGGGFVISLWPQNPPLNMPSVECITI